MSHFLRLLRAPGRRRTYGRSFARIEVARIGTRAGIAVVTKGSVTGISTADVTTGNALAYTAFLDPRRAAIREEAEIIQAAVGATCASGRTGAVVVEIAMIGIRAGVAVVT